MKAPEYIGIGFVIICGIVMLVALFKFLYGIFKK